VKDEVQAPDRNVLPALDSVLFHVAREDTIEQGMPRETRFLCRIAPISATFRLVSCFVNDLSHVADVVAVNTLELILKYLRPQYTEHRLHFSSVEVFGFDDKIVALSLHWNEIYILYLPGNLLGFDGEHPLHHARRRWPVPNAIDFHLRIR
jgi:hypothetical protein